VNNNKIDDYNNNMSEQNVAIITEVWTIKGYNLYTVKCIAKPHDFSRYLPTFQKVIDSFEIQI
jgi:hypothetical protein